MGDLFVIAERSLIFSFSKVMMIPMVSSQYSVLILYFLYANGQLF